MSAPFTGSIVGSWLFTHSPPQCYNDGTIIYHYDAQGVNHWELPACSGGGRELFAIKYAYSNSTLTYKYGSRWCHETRLEDLKNGEILAFDVAKGLCWRMRRLKWPLSFSVAFINDEGLLVKSLELP